MIGKRQTNRYAKTIGLVMAFGLGAIFINAANASSERINQLMEIKPKQVPVFPMDSLRLNQTYLRTDFANAQIKNLHNLIYIRDATIQKIQLIYSDFQVSETFNQPALNRQRLLSLQKLLPGVFENTMIKWSFIAQTKCSNEKEARKMFHGFVITYRPRPSKRTMTYERKIMKEIVSGIPMEKDSVEHKKIPKIKRRRIPTGMYYPRLKAKKRKGILYTRKSIWNRRQKYLTEYDTTYRIKEIVHYKVSKKARKYISFAIPDSTIFEVMERNGHWNNILFVCDVTGSMSPYSAQLLVWHKLNYATQKAEYYTFFNDGDNKPDRQKRIGSTGGIYTVEGSTYNDVEKTIYHAMTKGYGGDIPENDVEALLKAIESCNGFEEIVLVADNWSNVKDIELLDKVDKPIRIILCGAHWGGINIDYLNLARETGGSIHTLEDDIENLMELNEGETFQFGDYTYVLSNGKFYPSYKL